MPEPEPSAKSSMPGRPDPAPDPQVDDAPPHRSYRSARAGSGWPVPPTVQPLLSPAPADDALPGTVATAPKEPPPSIEAPPPTAGQSDRGDPDDAGADGQLPDGEAEPEGGPGLVGTL